MCSTLTLWDKCRSGKNVIAQNNSLAASSAFCGFLDYVVQVALPTATSALAQRNQKLTQIVKAEHRRPPSEGCSSLSWSNQR
jgi:hypothetical protein